METTQCVFFLGIVLFSVGFYLAFYVLTPTVVKRHITEHKGQTIEVQFVGFDFKKNPKGDASYKTRFLDNEGNEHESVVAVNLFLGAYFIDDKIVHYSKEKQQ